ncbi:Anaphase-promoting complex subunit 7 [Actinomortierella ambigua]|nr:Anaphase-promoting complex subunit 7 [Actinomortierella ambigua]
MPPELQQSEPSHPPTSTTTGDEGQSTKDQSASSSSLTATSASTTQSSSAASVTALDREQFKDKMVKTMAHLQGIKRKATHSGASQLPNEGPDLARSSFYMFDDPRRAKAIKSRPGRGVSEPRDEASKTSGSSMLTRTVRSHSKGMDFNAKLQYARSLVEMGELLITFPEEKRSVAFYLLNIKMGKLKLAVINRKYPVAIEAHLNLLRLRLPLDTVLQLIPDTCREKPWMTKYLTGMDAIFSLKYQAARAQFESLNASYPSNVDILLKLAYCHFWQGETVDAYMKYLAVQKVDRYVTEDLHLFATALQELEKPSELSSLVVDLMQYETKQAETWVVLSIHCLVSREPARALQSVNRALSIDREHAGAHRIRGQLLSSTDPKEAIFSFRESLRLQKNIFSYEGLVSTYLAVGRRIEALATAKEARRELPQSARVLALYGTTLFHAGGSSGSGYDQHDNPLHHQDHHHHPPSEATPEHALQVLQEAYALDRTCSEAVWGLVTVLEYQKEYSQALAVLDELLEGGPIAPTQQPQQPLLPLLSSASSSAPVQPSPFYVAPPTATGTATTSTTTTTTNTDLAAAAGSSTFPSSSSSSSSTSFPTTSAAPQVSVVKIHLRKAELYNGMANWEQCYLSYQRALVVDPTNEVAKAGIARVERIFNGDDEEEEEEMEEEEVEVEAIAEERGEQSRRGVRDDDEEDEEEDEEQRLMAALEYQRRRRAQIEEQLQQEEDDEEQQEVLVEERQEVDEETIEGGDGEEQGGQGRHRDGEHRHRRHLGHDVPLETLERALRHHHQQQPGESLEGHEGDDHHDDAQHLLHRLRHSQHQHQYHPHHQHHHLSSELEGGSSPLPPRPPRAPAPSRTISIVPPMRDVEMEDPFAAALARSSPTTTTTTSGGGRDHRGRRGGEQQQRQEEQSPGEPVFRLRRRATYSPEGAGDDEDPHGFPSQLQLTSLQRLRYPQQHHQQHQQQQQNSGGVAAGPGTMMSDGRTPFPRSPSVSSSPAIAGGAAAVTTVAAPAPVVGGGGVGEVGSSTPASSAIAQPDFESMTPAQRRQMRQAVAVTERARGGGGGTAAWPPSLPHTPSLAPAARQQQQLQAVRRGNRQPLPSGQGTGGEVGVGGVGGVGGSGGGGGLTMVTPRRRPSTTQAQRESEYDEFESEQME